MEDGENLKVKAILEYEDGITLNNRLVFIINSKNLFYLFFFFCKCKSLVFVIVINKIFLSYS